MLAEREKPVRHHIPTDDVELPELLDRILEKGLLLGSAKLLAAAGSPSSYSMGEHPLADSS